MKDKQRFVVYKEVIKTYATTIIAKSEEEAHELVDELHNENPDGLVWSDCLHSSTEILVEVQDFNDKNQEHLDIKSKQYGEEKKFVDYSTFTFKDVLAISNKRQLKYEEFEAIFDPVTKEDDTQYFESLDEIHDYLKLNKIDANSNDLYRNIWTYVDGNNNSSILLNGFHFVNKLGYVYCNKKWGNGTSEDKDYYIEVYYN